MRTALGIAPRKRKVGILEILTEYVSSDVPGRLYSAFLRKQFYSIMPQAIAAWCRRRGHQVTYATYYGQARPDSLLPRDLDVVFVGAYSQSSAIAYALAKIFRKAGMRTVLGGPHARSFPADAKRFFDVVVVDCDDAIIMDIIEGHYDPGSVIFNGRLSIELPLLAERHRDVEVASSYFGRSSRLSLIGLLASTGCPYACDFCVDWDNPYRARSTDDLKADLEFCAKTFPNQLIAFHDPNFGVNFDAVLSSLETIPPKRRNPYIIESSLSILKSNRLARLKDTKCAYLAPGVESWGGYSNKAGTGRNFGRDKYDQVCAHFRELSRYVPALQANFIFGSDADVSGEPLDLTLAFINSFPNVFPALGVPIAFGATPLRESLRREGRLVPLPPLFFANPMLTARAKHYDTLQLTSNLVLLLEAAVNRSLTLRRMRARISLAAKVVHALRTLDLWSYLPRLRRFRDLLATDHRFRGFHEGAHDEVPEFYHAQLEYRLGVFSELIPRSERLQVVE